ncbi:MAG TPA: glycosyl hydrolase family 28-related protein [Candidatus Paceibacterota bacterium]
MTDLALMGGDRIVSPQTYGATGSGTADDTAAIQRAINACPSGGIVLFPPGTYKLTDALTLQTNITLRGNDEYSSALIQSNSAKDCIRILGQGQNTRFNIDSLYIQGGVNGIHVVSGFIDRNSSFHNLRMVAFYNAAIFNEGAMIGCTHSNLHIEGPGPYGLYSDVSDGLGSTTWVGLRVAGADTAAVYIKQPSTGSLQPNVTFINPVLEFNDGPGLMLYSTECLLVNPHFEGNGAAEPDTNEFPEGCPDISLDSNYPAEIGTAQSRCTLMGGMFSNPGAYQVGLTGPYTGSKCRIWAKNYGCSYNELGVYHISNDRADCDGHVDKLSITQLFPFVNDTLVVFGHATRMDVNQLAHWSVASILDGSARKLGFYTTTPIEKPTISTADAASIITALAALGLVTDGT